MDYRYLKAFLLTAEYCSFSRAAEELNIAQSAVSRQIKLLEQELGEELIIRSPKKVLLTRKGKELYQLVTQFDKTALELFQREDLYPARIGVLHGLLESWLVHILVKFYKTHARNMVVTVDSPYNLKKRLSEGDVDIIFTTENIQNELMTGRKLFDERLVLISKKEINIKELQSERWIVYNDSDYLFSLAKKKSESIISVDSITTIVNLARSGVGIAVVPDHMLTKTEKLFMYDLPELTRSEIFMVTNNYKRYPSHIKEVTDIVYSTESV